MVQYSLKYKWLYFVPIIGFVYIFMIGFKIGFLTKLQNINGWESLGMVTIQAVSLVVVLLYSLLQII